MATPKKYRALELARKVAASRLQGLDAAVAAVRDRQRESAAKGQNAGGREQKVRPRMGNLTA